MTCDGTGALCAIGACPLCPGVGESTHAEVSHAHLTPSDAAIEELRAQFARIWEDEAASGHDAGPQSGTAQGNPARADVTRGSGSIPPSSPTPVNLSWSEYEAGLELGHPSDDEHEYVLEEGSPAYLLERLTATEAADLLRELDALDMTEDLYKFLLGAWPELEPGTVLEDGHHIRAVCAHVQAQLEDRAIALGLMPRPAGWSGMRAQNLLIRIPPRCLKTIIVTVCATAWAWLRWPTMRILSLSSNPRVTSEAADKVRSLIRSDWYQQTFRPSWRIREDMDALSKFANTAGGWRAARGMTSRITGEGADWLVIDDPHDGAEVYSKAKRDAVNQKWRRSVANRVNDPRYAIRTGVMQALHFDDWGQQRIADGWGVLVIRMLYEARDAERSSPYGWRDWRSSEGTPLHERFTAAWCAQEKKDKGAIDWAAQYQQDPAPIDGGIVRESDLRYYDETPAIDAVVISVDAAFKKTASGSRVSVLVVGRGRDSTGKQIRVVLDNDTRPMHMGDTIAAIKAMRARWPRAKTILVEDKANGSEIVRQLQLEFVGVVPINPGNNSKEGRLMAVQSLFLSNAVFFPRHATWIDDMKYEVCTFPNAPKDDQVDALVQALLYMRSSTAAARSAAGCRL